MIYVTERQTNKLPGITSLFVHFDYNRSIVDEIKVLENSIFDKETKEWEVPIGQLSELIDRCCLFDDISITTLPNDEKKNIKYDLTQYKQDHSPIKKMGYNLG